VATTASPPTEALTLVESVSLVEADTGSITKPDGTRIELGYDGEGNERSGGVFDAKGRVPVVVIRPGLGGGRGRHLYEAKMLSENAHKFTGWKQYLNHLSPDQKKSSGGLPRDVRDLGGRLQETWWDPNFPSDNRFDQGAVMGMSRPVRAVRELIDDDPGLVEASISASATGVRPVVHSGARAWLVEGINDRGSLDWVTEAGAGGRIAPLLEGIYSDPHEVELALVESLDAEELRDYYREQRGGAAPATTTSPEGGDVSDITPEALTEALSASPNLLIEALSESTEVQAFIARLVESQVEDQRERVESQAQAQVARAFQLSRLERLAHQMISESRLPESWQKKLREEYSLDEATNKPKPKLDVEDDEEDEDDPKAAKKKAEEKLREAVKKDIEDEKERLADARPTRVKNAGGKGKADGGKAALAEGETDDGKPPAGPQPYWAQVLSEAGFEDPDKIYAA
jgi:hypothetical protein